MLYIPFILPLVLVFLINIALALYAQRLRNVPAAQPFSWLMILTGFYALLSAFAVSTFVLDLRVFWYLLIFIPVTLVPPTLLWLVIEYTGDGPRLTRERLLALYIVPIISIIFALTSPWHALFRYGFQMDLTGTLPVLLSERGLWYWVHVTYSEILAVFACALLVKQLIQPTRNVFNTALLLIGILIPLTVDFLFQFGITPIHGYNLSVTLYISTSILYAWALLRGHMFELTPVARDSVFENMRDVVLVVDGENRLADYNHAAETVFHLTPRALGTPLGDALPKVWADALLPYQNNSAYPAEVIVGSAPEERCYGVTVSAVGRAQKQGRVFLLHEITERKHSEAIITEQNQQLKLLHDASQHLNSTLDLPEIYQTICDFMSRIAPNDALFISTFDRDTELITCRAYWLNNSWRDVSEFPPIPLEPEGKGTQSVVIRTGKAMRINDYQAQVRSSQSVYFVEEETGHVVQEVPPDEDIPRSALIVPLKMQDNVIGVIQVMSCRLNAYTENQLQLLEALALHIASAEYNARLYTQVQTELNERKQAEATLRASEEKFRQAFSTSPDAISILRQSDGVFVSVNKGFEQMTGYASREILGKTFAEVNVWLDPEERKTVIKTVLAGGEIRDFEARFVTPKGDLYGLVSASLFELEHVPHILTIIRDISQRKRAEIALRESEARFRKILEKAPLPLCYVDHDGNILFRNERFVDVLGYTAEDVPNLDAWWPRAYPDPQYRAQVTAQWTTAVQTAAADGRDIAPDKYRVMCKSGVERITEITGIALGDDFLATFIDMTERERAAQIMQARLDLMEFAAAHTLDEVLQNTLDQVSTLTGSPIGFYHFVESDQLTLSLQAWSTRTVQEFCRAEGKGMHYPIDRAGVWVDCVRSKAPVIHNDYAALPHRRGLPEGHAPVLRELVVPILRGEKIVAILGVGNKAIEYTQADVDLVTYFADVAWEIAERKKAEQKLAAQNTLLTSLINSARDTVIFSLDKNYCYTAFNQAHRAEMQRVWHTDIALGMNLLDCMTMPELRAFAKASIDRALNGETFSEIQHQPEPDIYYELSWNPIVQAEQIVGVTCFVRDITERKRVETSLHEYNERLEREVKERTVALEMELAQRHASDLARRESEAYVRNIFDSSLDMMITTDNERCIVEFNPAAEEAFGYTRAEVLGKNVSMLYANQEASQNTHQATVAQGTFIGEIPNRRKNGEIFYSLVSSAVMHNANGEPIGMVGVSRDITERRQTEQALRASEEKFRSIIENSRDGISLCDEQGSIIEWNDGEQEITGLAREDVLGKPTWDVEFQMFPRQAQTPELYENFKAAHEALLATGNSPFAGKRIEREIVRADGETRTVSVIITPIPTARGFMVGSISRDITESKKIELALVQSKNELEHRVIERTVELQLANAKLHNEIAERWQAQVALADETQQLALTLRSIGDGVITTDTDARVVLFNPVAEQLTGWTHDRAVGQRLTDILEIMDARTQEPLTLPFIQVLEYGSSMGLSRDTALISQTGNVHHISANLAPIRDNAGLISGTVLVFRDITLIRQAEDALQEARAAEAANAAKSQFLAHMSHEIRTPIHGITGLTTLLSHTELNGEQQEYLALIKSSADVLLDTVNDILDFSKIEAGKFELERVPFDFIQLVERALDQTAPQARKKQIEMVLQFAPDVPAQLMGDPTRLRQVLVNLFSNAVKFTERGEIVVTVAGKSIAQDVMELHVAVRDTGIGISADKQLLIFDAFRQSDGSTTRKYGGTGLGLAISQKLVELMGGRIWLESQVGEGSTFHFTVQLELGTAASDALSQNAAWKNLSALVIDDNATSRAMLGEVLARWGLRVTVTPNALAGLQALEDAREMGMPFALILLDSVMPKMDGFRAAGWFLDDAAVRDTVVMLLASDDVHTELARCRELGLSHHLLKPVKQSELQHVARAILQRAIPDSANVFEAAHTAPAAFMARGQRVLFVEDNAVSQLIGKKLLAEHGFVVQVADNGKHALAQLDKNEFDLILMDIEMPEMDGLQATRALRQSETHSGKHTPVIAMTAYGSTENREACMQAGMDGYVSKPFTFEKLNQAIQALTHAPARAASPAPETRALPDNAIVNMQVALDAVGGEPEFLQTAVRVFMDKDYPRHLEKMHDGLARGDAEALRSAAHGLRGALSSFGGTAACRVAERIEAYSRAGDLERAADAVAELESAMRDFAGCFALSEV